MKKSFAKKLASKHKREGKFSKFINKFVKGFIEKVKKPIYVARSSSLKKVAVEYEEAEALDELFGEPAKSEKVQAVSKRKPEAMVERLKEVYKL